MKSLGPSENEHLGTFHMMRLVSFYGEQAAYTYLRWQTPEAVLPHEKCSPYLLIQLLVRDYTYDWLLFRLACQ